MSKISDRVLRKNSTKDKKIKVESSSSEESTSSSDDEDYETSDGEEEEEEVKPSKLKKDKVEYTKFLSKMFPSKYMSQKVKDTTHEIDEKESSKTTSKKEKEKEREKPQPPKLSKNVNIFLTIDKDKEEDYDYDDSEYDDENSEQSESEDEDEDEEVSSDEDQEEDENSEKSVENKMIDCVPNAKTAELLKALTLFQSTHNNKIIDDCVNACKGSIQKIDEKFKQKEKKQTDKNMRIFKKMTRNKQLLREDAFFKKFDFESQKKIIKEMRLVNKIISIEKPYRLSLLESNIPISHKSEAMKKINLLKSMDPNCSEYYKIKHWVDSFMRIPFGEYSRLNVNISDGVEKSHAFMENAKHILDTAVYGLNDAKMQIMQMLGQFITNPNALGCALAIKGPPGTGKTSLVKEGISKILNRPFAFIALGGATDSSFLDGHSYTYEGSCWGKIVQILIDSKFMNPVIYFDELDKISETPKGDEIIGILTHLTDVSQNSQFHDKYFSELDFDLSKCMFIFSYNDESKINPILRDRMYRIQTTGYDKKQKNIIATQYLLPKIQEQVKFEKEDIVITDEVHNYIVENYCEKEDGVRNQKRCLEIIYTKLNLYRLMRPGSKLFDTDMIEVKFPFTVTKQIADKLITSAKKDNMYHKSLYV